MVEEPLVSVIVPTYNRATLIARALRSVLAQTYQNIEVIVVDDASSDTTTEVVASLQDGRIKYIRHDANRGGAAARNTGISAASGSFIAFQDSDDEWVSDKLEKQVRVLLAAPAKVGVVYCGFWKVTPQERSYIPSDVPLKAGYIYPALVDGNFIGMPTVVVRAECLDAVGGFDESLPRLQDWELFIRLSRRFEFSFIDEPLVTAYHTEGSISTNGAALVKALQILLERHYVDMPEHLWPSKAKVHYAVGSLMCQQGDFAAGRVHLRHAARLQRHNLKYLGKFGLTFLGSNIFQRLLGSRGA